MPRALAALALLALSLLSGCLAAGRAPGSGDDEETALRLVAFGDSFTAAGVPYEGDVPQISWATGTDPDVRSILSRVRERWSDAEGVNAAITGARLRDVDRMRERAGTGADVVVILLGINDYCWPEPTPLAEFAVNAREAFGSVRRDHPDATAIVFAIPDLWRMHELHGSVPGLLDLWQRSSYCADTFGAKDLQGADMVPRVRREAMNHLLQREAEEAGLIFSQATEWPGWTLDDLDPRDGFHPNPRGESRLAEAAWSSVSETLAAHRAVPVGF